jgi:hypothetical protein
MSFPQNTPTISELIDLPVAEIASFPAEILVALQTELNSAAHQLTTITTRFENALEARYGARASDERRSTGKDTGTIRFADGDVEVIANLPKRVDWNQAQLAALIEQIRASGDDPSQYVDIAIKVPERKYAAWPGTIRSAFAPARTVRTGKPTFRLSQSDEARR